jgi:hypothetical protein
MMHAKSPTHTSIRLLRLSAWGLVVTILIGLVTTIPGIAEWAEEIQATSPGREYVAVFLLVMTFDALVLWLSALRHSWVTSRSSKATMLLLLFTNFVGALFYYFLVARKPLAPSGSKAR